MTAKLNQAGVHSMRRFYNRQHVQDGVLILVDNLGMLGLFAGSITTRNR